MQRILVVEDDWEMNQGICYVLKENGYTSVSAHSIAAAKEICETQESDLVLLDVNFRTGKASCSANGCGSARAYRCFFSLPGIWKRTR